MGKSLPGESSLRERQRNWDPKLAAAPWAEKQCHEKEHGKERDEATSANTILCDDARSKTCPEAKQPRS
jgi:hypothetical protein